MALTFPFLCSFNVRQAERKFLTWLFTFLVLERIRRMASRGKEQGEGFFQALQNGVASRSCCAVQASVGDLATPAWITFRDRSSMMKKE